MILFQFLAMFGTVQKEWQETFAYIGPKGTRTLGYDKA